LYQEFQINDRSENTFYRNMCNDLRNQAVNGELVKVKLSNPFTQLNKNDHFLYAEFTDNDTHVNVHRARLTGYLFKNTALIGCSAVLYDKSSLEISIRDTDLQKCIYFLPKKYENQPPIAKVVRLKTFRNKIKNNPTVKINDKIVIEIERMTDQDSTESNKKSQIYCKLVMDNHGNCY